MSSSTTNLDLISSSQASKEVTANALFDAESPAALYGRRASTTANLTWGYYGGHLNISGTPTLVANGTKTLTNAATNYIEADPTTGNVSVNTANFTTANVPLYAVVTAGNVVTSYTDYRVGCLFAALNGSSTRNFSAANMTVAGLLDVSASGAGQVKFPATQNPSADANTLDDYEEGTFTPTVTFATPGDFNVAYSLQIGGYVKIGRQVTVTIAVITTAFTHTTASGVFRVLGIPFAAENVTNESWRGAVSLSGYTASTTYTSLASFINANVSVMNLQGSGSGIALTTLTTADLPTGSTIVLRSTITFFATT